MPSAVTAVFPRKSQPWPRLASFRPPQGVPAQPPWSTSSCRERATFMGFHGLVTRKPWLLPWNMGFPAEFPSSKCWEGFEQKVLSNINKMDHDGSTQYTEIQRLKRPQTVLGSAKIPSQLPWLLSLPPWCENDPPLPALLPPHQSYTMMTITPLGSWGYKVQVPSGNCST